MILDTNALSALAAKDLPLIAKVRSAARLHTTLISLGEFKYGLLGSRRRDELERWLEAFLMNAQILSPNMATLDDYAAIRRELKQAGTPIPANDCWIAALARQHRMPILSRDSHFDKVQGLRRLDW